MKTKIFGFIALVFGIFFLAGHALASTANMIQPAEATTNFESIRVGVAGQGGVTFFNGSVLNESGPYVIADDLRVDGGMFRTEVGPPDPIKVFDTMVPGITNTNDLGSDAFNWRKIYAKSGQFSEDVYSWGGLVTAARSEGLIQAGQSEKVEIPDGKPFQLLVGSMKPSDYGVAEVTVMENDWNLAAVGKILNPSTSGPLYTIGGTCCEYTSNYMLQDSKLFFEVQCPNEKTGPHNMIIKAKSAGNIYYRVVY